MIDWNEIKHFGPREFTHPDKMDPDLVKMLDVARMDAEVPFVITDSWRPTNAMVGVRNSTHKLGKAVDIACSNSAHRFRMVRSLLKVGFKRIGIYDRHIHVDLGTRESGHPEEVIWIGVSS